MSSPQLRLIDQANVRLEDFDLFWEIYPRKKAKLDALRAWQQTREHRPEIEQIIAAVHAQLRSGDWTDYRYIPYPATWLRAGQWDDE